RPRTTAVTCSAYARRPHSPRPFAKQKKYSAKAADRHPYVKKNLQVATNPHAAYDQHALSENIRSGVKADGIRQFPQQHAAKQEAQADEQRDTAVPKQQP